LGRGRASLDRGTGDTGSRGTERFGRFRLRIAAIFVVRGVAALLTLGWSGIAALAGYSYGYGYGYQYGPPHLTVIKHVVNDDGGGADASQFT
jgi:hypothetical protein